MSQRENKIMIAKMHFGGKPPEIREQGDPTVLWMKATARKTILKPAWLNCWSKCPLVIAPPEDTESGNKVCIEAARSHKYAI